MKIAIDLDSTLVNHVPLYKKAHRKTNTKFPGYPSTWNFGNWEDAPKKFMFDEFEKNPPDEMIKLTPFPGVSNKIIKLKKECHWCEIVTCRIPCDENFKYIIKLFPEIFKVKIIGLNQSKIEYLNDNKFDIWIDDYPIDYKKFNGETILIANNTTPYNHYLIMPSGAHIIEKFIDFNLNLY